ncbi:hypothetical protein HAX54_042679 [Datura stramonium]|uniref:Uncharacterized protein n=1 Tax=Datura stramonium TaxID=4076 RepID=A0ABS8W3I4_DATST|nr:hypothetical protein [Datura stramonium]
MAGMLAGDHTRVTIVPCRRRSVRALTSHGYNSESSPASRVTIGTVSNFSSTIPDHDYLTTSVLIMPSSPHGDIGNAHGYYDQISGNIDMPLVGLTISLATVAGDDTIIPQQRSGIS